MLFKMSIRTGAYANARSSAASTMERAWLVVVVVHVLTAPLSEGSGYVAVLSPTSHQGCETGKGPKVAQAAHNACSRLP